MPTLDICLSPELLHLFNPKGKIVVVTDILRATSCMVTGLANGVHSIIPVDTLDKCRKLGLKKGYITAAERDGKKAEGFDIGNSPFSYMEDAVKGKTVVVTTTNGTRAISEASDAKEIIIGSFLNLDAIASYLSIKQKDVIVVCAGWKGHVNMEDTLFAGALAHILNGDFTSKQDATDMAIHLWNLAKDDLEGFLSNCSHARRLQNLDITDDIAFCLTLNKYQVVPVMKGESLVPASLASVA